MSRPLRLEYPGALYHVTSRGNARASIFLDDADRAQFIRLLKDEVMQQGWICFAWCLMDNHYHFLIETPEGNLSRGMQRLNGRYTQHFNRSHGRVGHVFQGRYKAILVEKESHLLELCRYVVLNPVRAGMVDNVRNWAWSSYHDTLCNDPNLKWLADERVLELFSTQRDEAIQRYRQFVDEGVNADKPWNKLRGQIYLGGDDFLSKSETLLASRQIDADIPSAQCHPERAVPDQVLSDVAAVYGLEVNEVLNRHLNRAAYRAGVFLLRRACNLSLKDVAGLAGISLARVSQIQKQVSNEGLNLALKNYKVKACPHLFPSSAPHHFQATTAHNACMEFLFPEP